LPGLVQLVAAQGLQDRFRFVGTIQYDRISPYLMAADVGLQLLTDMCMGTKVLMYMSHHLPVVSTGGWFDKYGEFLRDGENIVLIPPDEEKLREALTRLLPRPAELRLIGEAGWRSVRPYSWDRHAEETLRLLRETVALHAARK